MKAADREDRQARALTLAATAAMLVMLAAEFGLLAGFVGLVLWGCGAGFAALTNEIRRRNLIEEERRRSLYG